MEKGKLLWLTIILWLFVGSLGAHRFYIGYNKSAIAMLTLTVLGWLTTIFAIGFVFLLAVGTWLIVDLIMILTGKLKPADGSEYI